MRISNFEVSMLEAKRFSKVGEKIGNVRIDHNSTISQITKVSDDLAALEFRFTVNYAGMGFIKIEGVLNLETDAEALTKGWAATGAMPDDVANLVHNTIVSNCLPIALLVSRDVRMPPPVPLPRINIQKKPPARRSDGQEVA